MSEMATCSESAPKQDDDELEAYFQSRTVDVNLIGSEQSQMRFQDFHLKDEILRGLTDSGFVRPSPVQLEAIPVGMLGRDLIVQAKSGTGKTVVFCTLILQRIDLTSTKLQALILAPTREVAYQSRAVLLKIGAHMPKLNCQLFVGGVPLQEDLRALQNCQIAFGTPGRIKYLIETKRIDTETINIFVLDEADLLLGGQGALVVSADTTELVTRGKNTFPCTVNWIWWTLPREKQVIALSATYSEDLVGYHLPRYMRDPILARLATDDPSLVGVTQYYHVVKMDKARVPPHVLFRSKLKFVNELLSSCSFIQCMVFSNFHSTAEELCNSLTKWGWPVAYISANLNQEERFQAYDQLRSFRCRVLVSTDLTARGVDAENVDLVVNMEVPWEPETYLHRVGRAGRFGGHGASVTVISNANDELEGFKQLRSQLPQQVRPLPKNIPADLTSESCQDEIEDDELLIASTAKTSSNPTNAPGSYLDRQESAAAVPDNALDVEVNRLREGEAEKSTLKEDLQTIGKELTDNPALFLHAPHEGACYSAHIADKLNHVEQSLNEFLDKDFQEIVLLSADTSKEQQPKSGPRKPTKFEQDRSAVLNFRSKPHAILSPKYYDKLTPESGEADRLKSLSYKQRFFFNEYKRLACWAHYYYSQYSHYAAQLHEHEQQLKDYIHAHCGSSSQPEQQQQPHNSPPSNKQ